jgi:hypothetical protein
MTDTTTEGTETVTEATTPTEKAVDWQAEAEKWKTLSRKNEETAKANSSAAKKLAELEEANKSEIEKAQARADAAEKELNQSRIQALRAEVALDKKLTPSQAKRLVGSTREELEADADELLADLKNTAPAGAPTPDGQGKQGDPVGQTKQITSRDELSKMTREEKLAAYRDGRLKSLTG